MSDRPAVLFVCLGNICRSPLAEAAFRAVAQRRGVDIAIDSAGTGTWHTGNPPDPRSQEMARRHGLNISQQRARQVRPEDFERFSHIVAMDGENLSDLRAMRPDGARAALSLLLDHVEGRAGQSVADPYYGGPEGFANAWADADAAAEGLLCRIAADG